MRRQIKIIILCMAILAIWGIISRVQADSMNKIDMEIYVDKSGNAHVTEKWDCKRTEGTENYHPYYNLGESEITDLTVSEEKRTYQTVSVWNVKSSFENKAYKCGLNSVNDGVEICWGVSQYGSHKYTVKYTITNFVASLTDSQMIYWTLIPKEFSNYIPEAHIKIYTDDPIPDTVGVWGYGDYGGLAYVQNGYIEMYATNGIQSSEYMTILAQFPVGTFQITNQLYHDFEYYLELAEEGSTHYTDTVQAYDIFMGIFVLAWMIAIPVVVLLKKKGQSSQNKVKGKKIPKDAPYFRDIPCDGDLMRAYYVGYQYGIIRNKTDILGAIILEWLSDSIISIEKKESKSIFSKENTVINLKETQRTDIKGTKERELFRMLKEASVDGILEGKEFEKWCQKSYSRILSWFDGEDGIIQKEQDKLEEEGYIIKQAKATLLKIKNIYYATPKLNKLALELAGLKRFLLDYTLISEREAIEVHLLEKYLIYAQMLGIAKKVTKQFKEIYPEILELSQFTSYDAILFINDCSSRGMTHAENAQSLEAARSYSSGGGGFSSGGGGGGSFGGRQRRRRLSLKKKKAVLYIKTVFFQTIKNENSILKNIFYRKLTMLIFANKQRIKTVNV